MKFLVATDGSRHSDRAIEYALELAAAADADLTVAHVVNREVSEAPGTDAVEDFEDAGESLIKEGEEDAERRGQRVLEEASDLAAASGIDVGTELLYGDPVGAVADFAAEEGFDMVFVGHRGLSERAERVLGSVAKGLVERSTVPVTVIR